MVLKYLLLENGRCFKSHGGDFWKVFGRDLQPLQKNQIIGRLQWAKTTILFEHHFPVNQWYLVTNRNHLYLEIEAINRSLTRQCLIFCTHLHCKRSRLGLGHGDRKKKRKQLRFQTASRKFSDIERQERSKQLSR